MAYPKFTTTRKLATQLSMKKNGAIHGEKVVGPGHHPSTPPLLTTTAMQSMKTI